MEEGNKKLILAIMIVLAMFAFRVKAEPIGANLTLGESSRGSDPVVQSIPAQAGNITPLNIDQSRVTDIWQGYFGNISGNIVLESSAGASFYDWSLTSVTGEVYATRNLVLDWSNINCTTSVEWETEESNLNILNTSADGINETFSLFSHPSFLVGTREMMGCPSTRPYNSTGNPGDFWNVLLNTNSSNTIYTAVIADSRNAFDNSTVDFEIMVPVDRAIGTSTYYFYVELY